jgi:hypothetical protein
MNGSQRCVYEGSAKSYKGRPRGEPVTLEHAMRDAYDKAIAGTKKAMAGKRQRTHRFRVVAIYVEGSNPPSDYKVELANH